MIEETELAMSTVPVVESTEYLGWLEREMDRRIDEAARTKNLSRKGAVQRLFGDAGESETNRRDRTLGDWLFEIRRGDEASIERKYGSVKASLTGSSGAQGGYLVPEEFLPRLYAMSSERAVVRPRATVIPMASRSVHVPVLDSFGTPASGDSALFAGLVARWTEEGGPLNQTEPTFRQIEMVAHELSGYSKVSNTILEDSPMGVEALLAALFGAAIAWHEDYAFLRGDGVGKPLGAVASGNAAAVSVNRASASSFGFTDATKMLSRFLPGYGPDRSAWVIHPTVIEKLIAMSDLGGNNLFMANFGDKPRMMLLGLPVLTSEKLPALGTARDVCLVNFEHYLIGDRRQVEIAFSEHIAFTTNQSAWRFTVRVDGQPWMKSSLILADSITAVSPYVWLN